MPITTTTLEEVLRAAERLLSAREDEMLTTQEWDDLQHAVAVCREPPTEQREETFSVGGGFLVRRIVPSGPGEPYEERCSKDALEEVVHGVSLMPLGGFLVEDLRRMTDLSWTPVAVAVAALTRCGCITPVSGRQYVAAPGYEHDDVLRRCDELARGR